MKVSEINQLLKDAKNSSVTLDEKKGKVVFAYLLDTYEILSEKDIDKGRKLGERYTILLNCGEKRTLSHTANYRRNGNISYDYIISL